MCIVYTVLDTAVFMCCRNGMSHSEGSSGSLDERRAAPGGRRLLDQANRLCAASRPNRQLLYQHLLVSF